ncbi:MAG: hypothetical protein ACP5IO_03100 [Elusimicrobiales bacterium]
MISFLFFIFCLFASSQTIDIWLEKNESKIPSKTSYVKVDAFRLSKNKDYRIVVRLINSTNYDMGAVVMRYSLRLELEKSSTTFETVSIIASSLRASDVKRNSSKNFYIYDIKKIFNDILRYKKLSYKPVNLKVEIMKEPKKNEEMLFKNMSFIIED